MPVPPFKQTIAPLLRALTRHPEGVACGDVFGEVADLLELTDDDRKLLLPSGHQPIYQNRIGWAHDRLKRARLSTSTKRGYWTLTEAGLTLGRAHPEGIPAEELERIMEFPTHLALETDADEPSEDTDPANEVEDRIHRMYRNPDERRVCLELLAYMIERAHTYGSGVWETTLFRRKVRLNVGMFLSVELAIGQIGVGLITNELPADLKLVLDEQAEWLWRNKTDLLSQFCRIPIATFVVERERITTACEAFLDIAGRSARQTPYHNAHSPALVDYLESAVGRSLPRPEYVRREPGASMAELIDAPIERAVAITAPRALFKKVDYDLTTLLTYIEMGDIGLPDIQRPFVWSAAKVRDLLDSMYRGFPVGYLLLWENSDPDGGRGVGVGEKSRKTPGRLIVDGQQRLTSLYAVLRNKRVFDEDFREVTIEIAFRPRDGRFEVSDAAIKKDPEWIANLSDLWAPGQSMRRLINDFLRVLSAKRALDQSDEDAMSNNIERLYDLQKYPFSAVEILPTVEAEDVADIFVRINSEGVKLNQSDFILTMLSVFWDAGRSELERFARQSRIPPLPDAPPSPFNHFVQPSPDQMLRAAVAVGFHRGRLRSVYQILRGKDVATGQIIAERREEQFSRLREAQAKTLDLKHWHLFLSALTGAGFRSSDMISSQTSIFYAYSFYLIGKLQCSVDEHKLRRLMSRWFFMISITGRYTGSTESMMDSDLTRLKDLNDPTSFVDTLERIITTTLTPDFWEITVPTELETSSARSPTLLAYYAAQCRLDAPVLFSDRKLSDLLDPSMRTQRKSVERHHLYPRAWLERQKVTDVRVINQAANFAHVEWPDNSKVSDAAPEKYVPLMRERFSKTSWDRMCSLHALPEGWESLPYQEFLSQRRKLMANVIRRGFESIAGGDEIDAVPADASAAERRVWSCIEEVELALRAVVRAKYTVRWASHADDQMQKQLGDNAWNTIANNREKHERQYARTPKSGPRDVLDYCYLGQLTQLMLAGPAWELFRAGFRDKRELEDIVSAITPVRNDRAHFRHVPERELDRCRVACGDLLAVVTKPSD